MGGVRACNVLLERELRVTVEALLQGYFGAAGAQEQGDADPAAAPHLFAEELTERDLPSPTVRGYLVGEQEATRRKRARAARA